MLQYSQQCLFVKYTDIPLYIKLLRRQVPKKQKSVSTILRVRQVSI